MKKVQNSFILQCKTNLPVTFRFISPALSAQGRITGAVILTKYIRKTLYYRFHYKIPIFLYQLLETIPSCWSNYDVDHLENLHVIVHKPAPAINKIFRFTMLQQKP